MNELARRAAHLDIDDPTNDPKIKNWLDGTLLGKYGIHYPHYKFGVTFERENYMAIKMATEIQSLKPGFNPLPEEFVEGSMPHKFYQPLDFPTSLVLFGCDPYKVDKNIELRLSGMDDEYIFKFDDDSKILEAIPYKTYKTKQKRTIESPYNRTNYTTNNNGLNIEVSVSC